MHRVPSQNKQQKRIDFSRRHRRETPTIRLNRDNNTRQLLQHNPLTLPVRRKRCPTPSRHFSTTLMKTDANHTPQQPPHSAWVQETPPKLSTALFDVANEDCEGRMGEQGKKRERGKQEANKWCLGRGNACKHFLRKINASAAVENSRGETFAARKIQAGDFARRNNLKFGAGKRPQRQGKRRRPYTSAMYRGLWVFAQKQPRVAKFLQTNSNHSLTDAFKTYTDQPEPTRGFEKQVRIGLKGQQIACKKVCSEAFAGRKTQSGEGAQEPDNDEAPEPRLASERALLRSLPQR